MRIDASATVQEQVRERFEHRGWDAIHGKHPARHGLAGEAFSSMIGLYWGDVLTGYRQQLMRSSLLAGT